VVDLVQCRHNDGNLHVGWNVLDVGEAAPRPPRQVPVEFRQPCGSLADAHDYAGATDVRMDIVGRRTARHFHQPCPVNTRHVRERLKFIV
jgi:hypothetical protein